LAAHLEQQLYLAEPQLAASAAAILEEAAGKAKAGTVSAGAGQDALAAAATAAAHGRPGADGSPARKRRKKLTQSHFTGECWVGGRKMPAIMLFCLHISLRCLWCGCLIHIQGMQNHHYPWRACSCMIRSVWAYAPLVYGMPDSVLSAAVESPFM
jgi:hypothetical protein